MQNKYLPFGTSKIVKKSLFLVFFLLINSFFGVSYLNAQVLLDNYDAAGTLTYTTEGIWVENGGVYEAQTGGLTTPEHSYAAYDLSLTTPTYTLNKANSNTWFGWIDLNRTGVGGWGTASYSAGMVLAANAADFNEAGTNGYAVVFNSDESLDLIKFTTGIVGGTAPLPGTSSIITSSGYSYLDGDNGVNFFVELLPDGKWKIYYLAGAQLSDANAIDKAKYTGGNTTSTFAEETYSGTTYKYAGWVYAHNTGSTAYFDNFGAGFSTQLGAGDIAFTGMNCDGTDSFSFVTLVDIELGTQINFTDNGWKSDDTWRTGEGTLNWVADASYSAGHEFEITNIGTMNFSTSGDQIIAYQGLESSPSFISALNNNGTSWQGDATSATTSALPTGLTDDVNCVAVDEADNIQYDRSITSGSKSAIRIAINTPGNWNRDNGTPYTLTSGVASYTIAVSEPSNHVTSFNAVANSNVAITNTWLDNDGSEPADGFLIMINLTGSFTSPVDGTPIADDTDLSDGNGYINIAHGVQTYTWNSLTATTGYEFKIFPYQGSGSSINYNTIETVPIASATTFAATDDDSDIYAPTILSQVTGTTISSLINTDGVAQKVFTFKIEDKASGDTEPTHVTNVRVRPNTSNTADWTDHIQGAKLYNETIGDWVLINTVSITDGYIDISIDNGDLDITDGGASEISLYIYLNLNNIVDNATLSFYIDQYAHGFEAYPSGSTFTQYPLDFDVESEDFTINVVASKLVFNSVPTDVNVGVDFPVEVWATDSNGNKDLDETSTISLSLNSGGGALSSIAGLTSVSLSTGSFSWSDVQYNVVETFEIIATGSLTSTLVASINAFTEEVAIPGTVIISEIMIDPTDVADASGEWIELYNSNSFAVSINGWTITDNDAVEEAISGATNIPANSFYVLGINGDNGTNGGVNVDYVYTSIVLDAITDEIILKNGTGGDIIDQVHYDSDWPMPSGSSIMYTGLIADDNNDFNNWVITSQREKAFLDDGKTNNGSPGTNGFGQNLIPATIWTGTGSNWSDGNLTGSSEWSNGCPGSVTDVTVSDDSGTPSVLTIDNTTAVCNDLEIEASQTVILAAGKALTINGNLTNSGGADNSLELLADDTDGLSSLITYGTVSGTATVNHYFEDLDLWYLISSPISGGVGDTFFDDYFYSWDEPSYDWINHFNTDYSLVPGMGYTIKKITNNTASYVGALNTGDITSPVLVYTDNADKNDGWNLMGNPYPSLIDISLLDFTNISPGVYVYLHSAARDTYVFWSKTLGTVGSSGGDGDIRARYIQPGQGFWIQTSSINNTYQYTNEMRSHVNQGQYSKSSAKDQPESLDQILKISLSANELTDPTYIVFKPNASNGFDIQYDLHKRVSSHPEVPHIFSLTAPESTEIMAVNAIETPDQPVTIPIGIWLGTNGKYKIYTDGINTFANQNFYLKDKLTGETFDLSLQNYIEFDHLSTNPVYRFDLIIGLQTDINNPIGISNLVEVFSAQNRLYIRPGENQIIKDINIVNLLGQSVYRNSYSKSFNTGVELNIPTAFYVVEIETETERITKKVFIQNQN